MNSNAPTPILETERLKLRPMHMDDWPDYADMMASDRAIHMGGPYSEEGAWWLFCHDTAQWTLMGHGALMLEDRATGTCLGQVGINHGPLFPERELGWFVYRSAEGKGYAREAAEAMRNWAFETHGLDTLVSYIHPENHRSQRLAEKLGGVADPDAPRRYPDVLVYRYGG